MATDIITGVLVKRTTVSGGIFTDFVPVSEVNTGGSPLASANGSLPSGTLNDLGQGALPGYISGTTDRLILTPGVGGTTINGLDASAVPDNFTILIINASPTDVLNFTHRNPGSLAGNRFSNANAGTVQLVPLSAARATYVVNQWQFA